MKLVDGYLKNFPDDYLKETYRLVRKYQQMIDVIVEQVLSFSPTNILDIGCGPGHVSEQILLRNTVCHITCIDAQPRMIKAAKTRLSQFIAGKRAELFKINIFDFLPANEFDLIFSNLTFKFFEINRKKIILRKIHSWLKEGGVFLWGDRITFKDKNFLQAVINRRKFFALTTGIDSELMRLFFLREKTDFPLTIEQTLEYAREIFSSAELIWLHDDTAIFYLRK